MSEHPVAFMSYVRSDDLHDNGRLTELCKRLSGEVRMQLGEEFRIFQDRNDIAWGQQWKQRIVQSLDAATFLIPIITPGFYKSPPCLEELELFLKREQDLGRGDLVLPVYYVGCPEFAPGDRSDAARLAAVIASRQFTDWQDLRFEPFTTPQVGRMLANMARQVVQALRRGSDPAPFAATVPTVASVGSVRTRAMDQVSSQSRADTGQTGEGSRGAPQKSQPPTRVVDALHRGDHASLTEALRAALPGDRILVRPGLYREGVVIDKPVEIVGDGELGEVVIEATGKDAVLFKANMGRIANLVLRQAGGGKWYCVDITQGRLDIEDCDITSHTLSCIAIRGGADPRLRRNRVHGGKQSGVFVYDSGQGTLEDNEIFENEHSGVAIESGGSPVLRRNRIYAGKAAGVVIRDSGKGTLEDNEIFGNAYAGVEIKAGGNPILRRNRIHGGKQSGVYVYDDGLGTLEDNDIFGNALAGVEIKMGGNPTLRRNRIHGGKQGGILVQEGGLGTLEDNEIFANAFSGVEIKTGGNPTLSHNRIQNGAQSGIHVHDDGQGVLQGNEISGNASYGVLVKTGGCPVLRKNSITKNAYSAVRVHEGGQGTFENNDLRGNIKGAWDIAEDCLGKVKRSGNQE